MSNVLGAQRRSLRFSDWLSLLLGPAAHDNRICITMTQKNTEVSVTIRFLQAKCREHVWVRAASFLPERVWQRGLCETSWQDEAKMINGRWTCTSSSKRPTLTVCPVAKQQRSFRSDDAVHSLTPKKAAAHDRAEGRPHHHRSARIPDGVK